MYRTDKPYKGEIKKLQKTTWDTPYLNVVESGGYALFQKKFDDYEIKHTDGIGTKGIFHWNRKTFRCAVVDAMAMNLNDLATVGAIPYAVSDHLIIPKDDSAAILKVIEELCMECRLRKIALVDGETSIQNNIDGMELSLTVSAFVPTPRHNHVSVGDVILGFMSSGVHSNGITLARTALPDWHDVFAIPTVIYYDRVMELLKNYDIHGMVHVAGGAFTRVKDLIPNLDANLNFRGIPTPNVFAAIHKQGVKDKELYSTFNCGIGFLMFVSPQDVDRIKAEPALKNYEVHKLGTVEAGNGSVYVSSAFSDEEFTL